MHAGINVYKAVLFSGYNSRTADIRPYVGRAAAVALTGKQIQKTSQTDRQDRTTVR